MERIKLPTTITGLICQVCGERASGFHYGVDTCSACKIFFRRNCDRTVKHRCELGNGKVRKSRRKHPKPAVLTCPGCRMEKCQLTGMAVEAIRKGRYTFSVKYEYLKKAQLLGSDGLDEEGNSTDTRTSSESSENQTSDGEDILALSMQRELRDLEASSGSPLSVSDGSRSASSGSPGPLSVGGSPCSSQGDAPLAGHLVPLDTGDPSPLVPVQASPTPVVTNELQPNMSFQPEASQLQPVVTPLRAPQAADWSLVPAGRTQHARSSSVIYYQPNSVLEEVEKLASRLSEMYISCGTFGPGFFDRIKDIEQCYVNHKLMNMALDVKPLAAEEYKAFYDSTGIDVDGRQERLTSRFISLERRLHSYVAFVKKIHGFSELPGIDQEKLFKACHTEIGCLSEYRSYNVCLGLRTLPEGMVLDYQDLLSTSHGDYVDLLFDVMERLHKMQLTEDMRNLLKCAALFSPEFCATEIGREKTAKQQNMMLRALELLMRHRHPQGAEVLPKILIVLGDMRLLRSSCAREIQMTHRDFPTLYTPQLVNEVCLGFRD